MEHLLLDVFAHFIFPIQPLPVTHLGNCDLFTIMVLYK